MALLLVTTAACMTTKTEMDRTTDIEQQLIKMEHELAEAAIRRDLKVFELRTADEFIGVDPLGRAVTKSQVMARFTSPDQEVKSLRHENVRVRVFGDCAVAIGRTVMTGRFKGQDFSGEFPYMRVWVMRQGRWQAVAAQSTSIPPATSGIESKE